VRRVSPLAQRCLHTAWLLCLCRTTWYDRKMPYIPAYELEAIRAYEHLPSLAFPEDLPLPCMMNAEEEVAAAEPTVRLLQTSVSIQIDAAHALTAQGLQPLAAELLEKGAQTSKACGTLIDETWVNEAEYVRDHCYNGLQRNALYYYSQPGALTEGRTVNNYIQASAYSSVTEEIVTPLIELGMSEDPRVNGAMASQRNRLMVMQLLNRMQAYHPTNDWAIVCANKREQHCDLLPDRRRQSNNFNLKIVLDGGDFIPLVVRGNSQNVQDIGMVAGDERIGTVFASDICGGKEAWSILHSMHFEASGRGLYPDQTELIRVATGRLMERLVSLTPVQKTAPNSKRSQLGEIAFHRLLEQGVEATRY